MHQGGCMFDAEVLRRRVYLLLGVLVATGGLMGAWTFPQGLEVQNVSQTLLGVFALISLGLLVQGKIPSWTIERLAVAMYSTFWGVRFLVEMFSANYPMGRFPLHSETGLVALVLMVFITLPTRSAMRLAGGLYLMFLVVPWLVLAFMPERRAGWNLDDFFRIQMITSGLVGLIYVLGAYKEQWVREQERTHWLHHIAYTDPLTGVFNRRRLYEILEEQTGRSGFSVVLFDLDHFKRINDRYGHATGDEVLKCAARETQDVLDQQGFVGRWGGEEFLLVFPDSDASKAVMYAEAIRRKFPETEVDDLQGFTASFGVAEHQPGEALDALIHRADQALYLAKARGRNGVVTHDAYLQTAQDQQLAQ